MIDSTIEALLVIAAAAVASVFGAALHCEQQRACLEAKTCTNVTNSGTVHLSCAFTNYVSLAGDTAYGGSGAFTYAASTQSVCAPGERIQYSGGVSACYPHYPYPDALSYEIQKDDTTLDNHEQACGKWIDAVPRSLVTQVTSFSSYGDADFQTAVKTAEANLFTTSRLSFTDIGKFYSSCHAAVSVGTNAIRASAKEAYAHLYVGLNVTNYAAAIGSLGFLSAHACDSPVDLGFGVSANSKHILIARRGTAFLTGDFDKALFALEQMPQQREAAEKANTYVNDNAFSSAEVTLEDYELLYEGATDRKDHTNVPLTHFITPEFDGYAKLAKADLEGAFAYLDGLAAMCASNLWGNLDLQMSRMEDADADLKPGQSEQSGQSKHAAQRHHRKPKAAALGRLILPSDADVAFAADGNLTAEASAVTFGQLRAQPVGDPTKDCTELARKLFPDRLDRLRFGILVPDRLYDRMNQVLVDMKAAVVRVLQEHASLVSLSVNTPLVVAQVQATKIRLPGAPRGSWAGIARPYVDAAFDASTSPLKIALLQANALFRDRAYLAYDFQHLCAGPPVYDSLVSNGYVFPGQACSHLMLGVTRRPWADVRYDDTSLYTRFGMILTHELAHHTAAAALVATTVQGITSEYAESEQVEAIADVVAALAIIDAGKATPKQVCDYVSQLFCGRVPTGYVYPTTLSHPPVNRRGNQLCRQLRVLGVL